MKINTCVVRFLSLGVLLLLAPCIGASPVLAQAPECGRTYPAQMFGGQSGRYGWEIGAGADCVTRGNSQAACTHFRAAELALTRVDNSAVMTPKDLQAAREYLIVLFRDNKC
jgi:hypothetical protein